MEGVLEIVEAEIDLADGLTGGEKILIGEGNGGDLEIDPQPLESLHVLPSVLQEVSDHVRPTRLLPPIPDLLRAPVCALGAVQLRIFPRHCRWELLEVGLGFSESGDTDLGYCHIGHQLF